MAPCLGTAALCNCSNSMSTALLMPSSPCSPACHSTNFLSLSTRSDKVSGNILLLRCTRLGFSATHETARCSRTAWLCIYLTELHRSSLEGIQLVLPKPARIPRRYTSLLSSWSKSFQTFQKHKHVRSFVVLGGHPTCFIASTSISALGCVPHHVTCNSP